MDWIGEVFPKAFRLVHQRQFDRVFQARKMASDSWLIVHAVRNGLDHSRLGLAIPRQYGTAVQRVAWKRRVRDAFRRHRSQLPTGMDLVVRPQRGSRAESEAIARSLTELVERLNLPRPPRIPASE